METSRIVLPHPPPFLLWKCSAAAFVILAVAVTLMGWDQHWLSHPHSTALDTSSFIDAQIFEVPAETHLVDEKKTAAPTKARAEVALSKVPQKGKPSPAKQEVADEENQTDPGTKSAATHGPVAIHAPPPVIPEYLRHRDIKAYVLIDFFVNAKGGVVTRLVGPSGDEELDAIALEAVKKWIFRPAEKDHQPIDSKVRLKIVFVVN